MQNLKFDPLIKWLIFNQNNSPFMVALNSCAYMNTHIMFCTLYIVYSIYIVYTMFKISFFVLSQASVTPSITG